MAANDEDYALQLHRQLNATSLRARRGQDLAAQQSLERLKREKAAKSRAKRTNSSSQEDPSSRKRRISDADDDYGHTSAQRRVKKEPTDSNRSPSDDDEHEQTKQGEMQIKPCDSRDSGMLLARLLHHAVVPVTEEYDQLLCCTPAQSAGAAAAAATRQLAKQECASKGHACVKVFYAGVRWGLSLPPGAIASRQMLAKALNDAYVGQIISVGQGEGLSVVFLTQHGSAAELGPTKWNSSTAHSAQWKALAKTAVKVYVREPEAILR